MFWRCQTKTLDEQYKLGVRAFDIRVIAVEKDGMVCWEVGHGIARVKQYFVNLEDICVYFKKNYPGSFVRIMLEKNGNDLGIRAAFEKEAIEAIQKYGDMIWTIYVKSAIKIIVIAKIKTCCPLIINPATSNEIFPITSGKVRGVGVTKYIPVYSRKNDNLKNLIVISILLMHKVRNLALFLQKSAILDARFLILLILIIKTIMTRTTQILFKLLMMLAIAGITLNSCEKQRLPGDWDPMNGMTRAVLHRLTMCIKCQQAEAPISSIAPIIMVFGFHLLKKTVSSSCPASIKMIGKISLDSGLMFSVCPMATSSSLSNHYHFPVLLLTAR